MDIDDPHLQGMLKIETEIVAEIEFDDGFRLTVQYTTVPHFMQSRGGALQQSPCRIEEQRLMESIRIADLQADGSALR